MSFSNLILNHPDHSVPVSVPVSFAILSIFWESYPILEIGGSEKRLCLYILKFQPILRDRITPSLLGFCGRSRDQFEMRSLSLLGNFIQKVFDETLIFSVAHKSAIVFHQKRRRLKIKAKIFSTQILSFKVEPLQWWMQFGGLPWFHCEAFRLKSVANDLIQI